MSLTLGVLAPSTPAQPVTGILPMEGVTVTSPPAFCWMVAAGSPVIRLQISTQASLDTLDVLDWQEDGGRYHVGDPAKFSDLRGRQLYWRLLVDGKPTPIRSLTVESTSLDPYYNLVHLGWPGGTLDPFNLNSFGLANLTAIKNMVGGGVGKSADRKLGISFHIPYFHARDMAYLKTLVQKLGDLAVQSDVAVLFGLDGFEWWANRPDLWNWWDPAKPGYNPANRMNVEWTEWDPASAVRDEGWRNWGSPIRMSQPHPNLASPAVIAANVEALKELAPVIRAWYEKLPDEKKYLFAGVKVGWEVSIGVNYYYGVNTGASSGRQVGYAAVKTLGLASSGTLKPSQLTRCIQNHFDKLTAAVLGAGIPRRKIFTHAQVMPPGQSLVFGAAEAALVPSSQPGWSFYTGTGGPRALPGLDSLLPSPMTWWANIEWGGGSNLDKLHLDFEAYRNNKMVAYYFNGYESSLAKILDKPPRNIQGFHWMHPPVTRSVVENGKAGLSWEQPSLSLKLHLVVSTEAGLDVSGILKNPDIRNAEVTGRNSLEIPGLASGTYYFQMIADGNGRRVVSDLGSFEIKAGVSTFRKPMDKTSTRHGIVLDARSTIRLPRGFRRVRAFDGRGRVILDFHRSGQDGNIFILVSPNHPRGILNLRYDPLP